MREEVAIVGAGIGGLTLAQGLTRVGVPARVYERDEAPEYRAQGYRVTLRPSGITWLKRCLPSEHFELLLRSSQIWCGTNVLNERLETLAELRDPKEPLRSIDRLSFRRILLCGIEERVHFGKTFEGFEQHAGGVTLHWGDGSSGEVSLLVGADGHQSRVRRALIPQHAELADTGQRDLAGKVPLTPEVRQLMRDMRVRSISIVTTLDGPTMVLIPQEFGQEALPQDGVTGARAHERHHDYLYWGLVAPRERYLAGQGTEPSDPRVLKRLARDLTRNWHPLFAQLIDMTPPDALNLLVFRSSVPHGPWRTGRVTLLGDAVHSMVPMRGEGANTAIRDAGALTDCLQAIAMGQPFEASLRRYEAEMLEYGFGKVRESLSALELLVSGSRFKRSVIHHVLRAVQRARSLFRGPSALT